MGRRGRFGEEEGMQVERRGALLCVRMRHKIHGVDLVALKP